MSGAKTSLGFLEWFLKRPENLIEEFLSAVDEGRTPSSDALNHIASAIRSSRSPPAATRSKRLLQALEGTEPRKGRGRPSKVEGATGKHIEVAFLYFDLRADGLTVEQALAETAEACGVDESTVRRDAKRFPEMEANVVLYRQALESVHGGNYNF